MTAERIFTNGCFVLEDRVIDGTLKVRGDIVLEVDESRCRLRSAEDLAGDTVIPGLVELHTDNFERHLSPRPGVRWPSRAALMTHDAQLAASGITTVLDAVAVGAAVDGSERPEILTDAIKAIHTAREDGGLRADHYLHVRCEVSDVELARLWPLVRDDSLIRLVSLMDHTPGQRQFTSEAAFRTYYRVKHRLSEAEIDALIERSREGQARHAPAFRREIAEHCRSHAIALASHDDATEAHVEEAAAIGCTIAEFPTTMAAAEAARACGLATILGAPNLVRGGSHSGNVAASELAAAGLLDMLASDYVPISLLHGAFLLHTQCETPLEAAMRAVSLAPAQAAGLYDRGSLAPGMRADFVRVATRHGVPVPRETWCGGKRVA